MPEIMSCTILVFKCSFGALNPSMRLEARYFQGFHGLRQPDAAPERLVAEPRRAQAVAVDFDQDVNEPLLPLLAFGLTADSESPIWTNSGIPLNFYSGSLYTLRHIPEDSHIELVAEFRGPTEVDP